MPWKSKSKVEHGARDMTPLPLWPFSHHSPSFDPPKGFYITQSLTCAKLNLHPQILQAPKKLTHRHEGLKGGVGTLDRIFVNPSFTRRAMPDLPPHPPQTVQSKAFAVDDLLFALAWSRLAPGLGGWRLSITEISTGEMVEIIPPGAEFPVFLILPRADHVEVIRERPIEAGGGQVRVATLPTLRDAVLLLCPLDAQHVFELQCSIGHPAQLRAR